MSKESTDYSILAADTSSPLASLAIVRGDKILASLSGGAHLPHSKALFLNLSILLQLAGLELLEIDAFAVATGPGSFTGLRVGLAAIKGLAHTLSKPAIGISSFDALALGSGATGMILTIIDAGREEAYCGLRQVSTDGKSEVIGKDQVGRPAVVLPHMISGIKSFVAVGSGALKFKHEIDAAARVREDAASEVRLKVCHIDTGVIIAQSAARFLIAGNKSEIHPYYIRPSDAEIKLIGQV
jgi:tRNA threonylcarbamoyladenosine biosynthesis protein TsaB